MTITGSRITDLLHWHDDMAADHTVLFDAMTAHRDSAALIRQLQAEVQDAWQAGLDEGRAQGAAKQPPLALACNYTPGTLDRTAPPHIWLQIDTAADNNDRSEPWPGGRGISWCSESIGGLEIQYVRADLAVQGARHD